MGGAYCRDPTPAVCENTDNGADHDGQEGSQKGCLHFSITNAQKWDCPCPKEAIEYYDVEDFSALDMCCICGGGIQTATTTTTTPGCRDTDTVNAPGRCTRLSSSWPNCATYTGYVVRYYEDDDFKPLDMCCSCGGGTR